jgi:hypothetical protein
MASTIATAVGVKSIAAGLMVIVEIVEVLAAKVALALKVAVILWVPAASDAVLNVQVPSE